MESCELAPDVEKIVLNVLVTNQEATKKKKVFQYIGRNEDKDEISLVDKGKRVARGSESTKAVIN